MNHRLSIPRNEGSPFLRSFLLGSQLKPVETGSADLDRLPGLLEAGDGELLPLLDRAGFSFGVSEPLPSAKFFSLSFAPGISELRSLSNESNVNDFFDKNSSCSKAFSWFIKPILGFAFDRSWRTWTKATDNGIRSLNIRYAKMIATDLERPAKQ